MSSKIKIKVGQVEVEFEGSEEFLIKEFPVLLEKVSSFATIAAPEIGAGANGGTPAPTQIPQAGHLQMTTNSIAAKLGVNCGSDLIIAAAAHLAIVKRSPTFSSQQILKEMQTATSYYKKSYSGNYRKYLKTITDSGTLIETATNAYALGATKVTELESKLAH